MADTDVKINITADSKKAREEIKLISQELKELGTINPITSDENTSTDSIPREDNIGNTENSTDTTRQRLRDRTNTLILRELIAIRKGLTDLNSSGRLNPPTPPPPSGSGGGDNSGTPPPPSGSGGGDNSGTPPSSTNDSSSSSEDKNKISAALGKLASLWRLYAQANAWAHGSQDRMALAYRTYGTSRAFGSDFNLAGRYAAEMGKPLGYSYSEVMEATRANMGAGGFRDLSSLTSDMSTLLKSARAWNFDPSSYARMSGTMTAAGTFRLGEQQKFAKMIGEAIVDTNMVGREDEHLRSYEAMFSTLSARSTVVSPESYLGLTGLYEQLVKNAPTLAGTRGASLTTSIADMVASDDNFMLYAMGLGTNEFGIGGRNKLRQMAEQDPVAALQKMADTGLIQQYLQDETGKEFVRDKLHNFLGSFDNVDRFIELFEQFDTGQLSREDLHNKLQELNTPPTEEGKLDTRTEENLGNFNQSLLQTLQEWDNSWKAIEAELGNIANELKGLPVSLFNDSNYAVQGAIVGGSALTGMAGLGIGIRSILGGLGSAGTAGAGGLGGLGSRLIGGLGGLGGAAARYSPWLGAGIAGLSSFHDAYKSYKEGDTTDTVSHGIRGVSRIGSIVGGAKAGAGAGGAIGLAIGGPAGGAIGAGIGSIVGGIGGFFAGDTLADLIDEHILGRKPKQSSSISKVNESSKPVESSRRIESDEPIYAANNFSQEQLNQLAKENPQLAHEVATKSASGIGTSIVNRESSGDTIVKGASTVIRQQSDDLEDSDLSHSLDVDVLSTNENTRAIRENTKQLQLGNYSSLGLTDPNKNKEDPLTKLFSKKLEQFGEGLKGSLPGGKNFGKGSGSGGSGFSIGGIPTSNDPEFTPVQNEMWEAAQWASKYSKEQYGIDIPPELIFKQWSHESGHDFNANPILAAVNNFGGLTQSEPNDLPQPDGNNFYRKFASKKDYAKAFVDDYISYRKQLNGVKTVEDYARIMYDTGYYTDDPQNYINGMNSVRIPKPVKIEQPKQPIPKTSINLVDSIGFGMGEGNTWIKQHEGVDLSKLSPEYKSALDVLGQWYSQNTGGRRLVISSGAEGDSHVKGAFTHGSGHKVDIVDVGGGEGDWNSDNPLITNDGNYTQLGLEFIKFCQQLGISANFEAGGTQNAHYDVNFSGAPNAQWNQEINPGGKTTYGGFNLEKLKNLDKGKSYGHGLARVPCDGFNAVLHKDERVLTKEEAKQFRDIKGFSIPLEYRIDEEDSIQDKAIKHIKQQQLRYKSSITDSTNDLSPRPLIKEFAIGGTYTEGDSLPSTSYNNNKKKRFISSKIGANLYRQLYEQTRLINDLRERLEKQEEVNRELQRESPYTGSLDRYKDVEMFDYSTQSERKLSNIADEYKPIYSTPSITDINKSDNIPDNNTTDTPSTTTSSTQVDKSEIQRALSFFPLDKLKSKGIPRDTNNRNVSASRIASILGSVISRTSGGRRHAGLISSILGIGGSIIDNPSQENINHQIPRIVNVFGNRILKGRHNRLLTAFTGNILPTLLGQKRAKLNIPGLDTIPHGFNPEPEKTLPNGKDSIISSDTNKVDLPEKEQELNLPTSSSEHPLQTNPMERISNTSGSGVTPPPVENTGGTSSDTHVTVDLNVNVTGNIEGMNQENQNKITSSIVNKINGSNGFLDSLSNVFQSFNRA